jgi:anti-anti-sigma factor
LVDSLRLEEGDGPASFRLIGELDLSSAPHTTARLREELRRADQLTLDVSEVTFMDSQGLRMLIELGGEATQKGTIIRVVNCSNQVKQLLRVAVPTGMPGVEIVDADR